MSEAETLNYFRARWPEDVIPEEEPEWMLFEISYAQDAVLRDVDIYPDGRVTRNSIEIEQRHGDECPSLIDLSLKDGFDGVDMAEITRQEFEDWWAKGTDQPFWFVC